MQICYKVTPLLSVIKARLRITVCLIDYSCEPKWVSSCQETAEILHVFSRSLDHLQEPIFFKNLQHPHLTFFLKINSLPTFGAN